MRTEKFSFQNEQVFLGDFLLKGISSHQFEVLYTGGYEGCKSILRDVKGIWWLYEFRAKPSLKFLTADIENFTIVNDDYAKDSKSVYLIAKKGIAIPGSDPDSFIVFEDTAYFAKDKHNLYALNASNGLFLFKDADNESLVPAGRGAYIADQDNLYYFGPPIELNNRSKYTASLFGGMVLEAPAGANDFEKNKNYLLEKHPDTIGWWHPDYAFELDISLTQTKGYHLSNQGIYYIFDIDDEDEAYIKPDYTLIRKADVSSFEVLSKYYAKDKHHVYFQHRVVQDVDPTSFKVKNHKLAEDDHALFFNGYKVACDKASFEILFEEEREYSFELVARDKDHLYVDQWTKFGKTGIRTGYDKTLTIMKKVADPSSFEMIINSWAKDKTHIYCSFIPQEKIDMPSFKYLFEAHYAEWAVDKNHLYQRGEIVKNIDGGTFEVLNTFWGKDAHHVFSFRTGRIRSKIDAPTFEATDDAGGGEDKDWIYYFDSWGELKKRKKKK